MSLAVVFIVRLWLNQAMRIHISFSFFNNSSLISHSMGVFKNEYENDWGIADTTCNVYQYRSNFSGRYK
ncbi:hypothetical protein [uncultured Methanobrevibacter sp.]|uniref:hypothetical protein n=1 Tax=uncultured Methanobrevibacter sp. TaxID=253161 RepID=UPI0025D10A36|nr:hypothetical protein [uncultured Methanobrevibacter sp.]